MDILMGVALIASVVIGVAGNLIASEIYDRSPSIARWLISRAAARLPKSEIARRKEEWLAHMEECPGKLGQLIHAVGCFRASLQIRKAIGSRTIISKKILSLAFFGNSLILKASPQLWTFAMTITVRRRFLSTRFRQSLQTRQMSSKVYVTDRVTLIRSEVQRMSAIKRLVSNALQPPRSSKNFKWGRRCT